MPNLDRFLCKPVEVEIRGEKLQVKPLTTKYYPLILRTNKIERKLLGLIIDPLTKRIQEPTDEDYKIKAEIDREISFKVMKDLFPELTQEQFDEEIPFEIIDEIMAAVLQASGLTEEKVKEVASKLKLAKEEIDKKVSSSSSSSE